MSVWAGIDVGTSGVKTVLIDAESRILADATAPLTVSRPHPGWSEQDPEDWWQATLATLDAIRAAHPRALAAVRGIGLSGQMHGAVMLDRDLRPVRPCILWNDGRATAECAALDARADFRRIGANLVMPGFTAPKVEWVRVNEPEAWRRIATVILPKDYLRLRLSGDLATDMSDASATHWLDVGARAWSPELLAATEMRADQMPRLVEGTEPTGEVSRDLCARYGWTVPPVVAGGGGDGPTSACGAGVIAPGEGFISLGTSGVICVATPDCRPWPPGAIHTFCHAVPATWVHMAVILSAADSLSWLSEITGRPPAELARLAEAADPASEVVFLPYLSGERTPVADSTARGAFRGLARASGIGDLARAVMEGVAFAFGDGVEALSAAGTQAGTVVALGGGARSDLWLQLCADVTGLPIAIPERRDLGASLGAARLGMAATVPGSLRAIFAPPAISHTLEPDRAAADRLAGRRARYRQMYPALRTA
jgi:xylulokinase